MKWLDGLRIRWGKAGPSFQSFIVGVAMGFVLGGVFGVAVCSTLG